MFFYGHRLIREDYTKHQRGSLLFTLFFFTLMNKWAMLRRA